MIGPTDHELALRTVLEGERRISLITALVDLEVFFETHPGAPVPDHTILSIRVPDGDDSAREEAVNAVAEALGVHAQWKNGCYIAARQFGPLTLEAHFTPIEAKRENARRALRGGEVVAA